jgi:hypothetical protein
MNAPICPICKVSEREFDSEPPAPGSYYSYCFRCSSLITTAEHNHTHYPSPAQVAAGTYKEGHSWRTAQLTRPIIEGNVHVGYRCAGVDSELCGWERRFTAREMETCPTEHRSEGYGGKRSGFVVKTLRYECFNSHDHRLERGEVNERGHMTDLGREVYAAHSDATNWDPGRYIEPRQH